MATRIEAAKASDANNDGQQHRLQPVALQRLHELRADRVADAEQEQQEQKGLGHARDGHRRKLPDEQAGEQRAGDRAKAERPEFEASDPVARGDHQEQRELRVADQELLQPD